MGREKPLCLFPDPVAPASKDTSSSDAKEQEGEEGRGTPGQRKERAPQIPRAGRKGLTTQSAAPHADEWETREPTPHGPTRLVARPLSLSLFGDSSLSFPPYHRDDGQMSQDTSRRHSCASLAPDGTVAVIEAGCFKKNGRQKAA